MPHLYKLEDRNKIIRYLFKLERQGRNKFFSKDDGKSRFDPVLFLTKFLERQGLETAEEETQVQISMTKNEQILERLFFRQNEF